MDISYDHDPQNNRALAEVDAHRTVITESVLGEACLDPLPNEDDDPERGTFWVEGSGRVRKRIGGRRKRKAT